MHPPHPPSVSATDDLIKISSKIFLKPFETLNIGLCKFLGFLNLKNLVLSQPYSSYA